MSIPCQTALDLLPLYHDRVTSPETDLIVEEHLNSCASCREAYSSMCAADAIEAAAFDKSASSNIAESYKQVAKKRRRSTALKILLIVGIIGTVQFAILLFLASVLMFDSLLTKPDVYTDTSDYGKYVDISEVSGFRHRLIDESIWPESITDDMNVLEFKLVHYDPWDPQYLGYMVVDYDDASYAKEMHRLKFERQMEYVGYYGATGFQDYEVAAMYADESGHGLVYALTDGEHRVVYVLLEFCNFFFDLKYEKYIPEEYLPAGFNAHEGNPYRDEWFEKVFGQ